MNTMTMTREEQAVNTYRKERWELGIREADRKWATRILAAASQDVSPDYLN